MHTIAVIEDDKPIQLMYKTKLELSGFKVVTADNGQEGLKVIKEHRPLLALVDLRMPIMSGDTMITKLREQAWGADIRIVVLTNISRAEAPSSLRLLGIDRFLVKAHQTPSQISEIVTEILG